jgi:hypothetical protein
MMASANVVCRSFRRAGVVQHQIQSLLVIVHVTVSHSVTHVENNISAADDTLPHLGWLLCSPESGIKQPFTRTARLVGLRKRAHIIHACQRTNMHQ